MTGCWLTDYSCGSMSSWETHLANFLSFALVRAAIGVHCCVFIVSMLRPGCMSSSKQNVTAARVGSDDQDPGQSHSRFMGTSTVNQLLPPLPPRPRFLHNVLIHLITHFSLQTVICKLISMDCF